MDRDAVMSLFFNRQPADSVEHLVSTFGARAFASPYRSTVPLVALVKDEPAKFADIVKRCGAGPRFNVHFEYQTAPPGIGGNPSQTDGTATLRRPCCTAEGTRDLVFESLAAQRRSVCVSHASQRNRVGKSR